MVADTHYSQVLFYTPEGQLRDDKKIGGVYGYGPGELHWVTDCVQDSQGCYYAGEMGEHDRIQKFSPDGDFQPVAPRIRKHSIWLCPDAAGQMGSTRSG